MSELSNKVKTLSFRRSKTSEVLKKRDRQACEQQKQSIINISKAVNELKETIEEKKFAKGENDATVSEWSKIYESEIEKADQDIKLLEEHMKNMDDEAREQKMNYEHEKNVAFELELLEHKAKLQEELDKSKQVEDKQPSKSTSGAKLPKLAITKYNGKIEAWLPFWDKFKSEIDSTDIPVLTKFAYLKELLDEKVRTDVDGLPFTEAGYSKAKEILEAEYGQMSDVVNTYVVNIMSLPVINGRDPVKINEFYKNLRYNVQSLDTMGRLSEVKGNVRATLDKLKGIKGELVQGHDNWQNWGYEDFLKALKTWREINPVEEKLEKQQHGSKWKGHSRLYHTQDGDQKSRRPECVYCEENTHKGLNCSKVKSHDERKKILAKKGLCFNCTGTQHRANDCNSKLGCQKCQRRHHTSICDQTEQFLGASSSSSVIHPVVIVQVGGYKCRALLDTGAGSSYISAALFDQIPKKCCKKEIRKIDMMLGTTTREVELSTIQVAGLSGDFSMPVKVTKVNKSELLYLDNPKYEEIIKTNEHMQGVTMDDHDTKDKLPVHIILGASEFAKLKTEKPPRVGLPGQPVAKFTRYGWTIMSPGKEPIDVSSMLLAQTSQADYEELCRIDVLGLEDRSINCDSDVYEEFKEQLTRDETGRYETGLPWCANHPPLPNNCVGSMRRLTSLTSKLDREGLRSKYKRFCRSRDWMESLRVQIIPVKVWNSTFLINRSYDLAQKQRKSESYTTPWQEPTTQHLH